MRMNTIIEELDRSSKTIAPEKLQEVIKKIKEHKRIFVYGTGRSGLMLKAFAMRLMQIGLNSYVVGETTTPSVQEGDLLIVASASGETGSVCMTAESAVKQGVDLIVISSAPESTLGKFTHQISRLKQQPNLRHPRSAYSRLEACLNRCF